MPSPLSDRTLSLEMTLKVRRHDVWRAWTQPDLMVQWFTPSPWRTISANVDLRPGGSCMVVMGGPNGEVVENPGVYLQVVPDEKLVFTNAFTSAWEPSEHAYMVATITLADAPEGGTLYHAMVQHWSAEDCESHRAMGFHDGWKAAARQLEALFA